LSQEWIQTGVSFSAGAQAAFTNNCIYRLLCWSTSTLFETACIIVFTKYLSIARYYLVLQNMCNFTTLSQGEIVVAKTAGCVYMTAPLLICSLDIQ